MKRLMLLLQHVLKDLERRCCVSTALDLKTIEGRVENEGLSFLTITLASLGKDFETNLKSHRANLDRNLYVGFKLRPNGTPHLFKEFFDLIFDSQSGRLLEDPNVEAISALRQITLMWAKMELPCSDARNVSAIDGYLQVEEALLYDHPIYGRLQRKLGESTIVWFPDAPARVTSGTGWTHVAVDNDESERREEARKRFRLMRTRLFEDVLIRLDKDVAEGNLIPKHGPGSTADRLFANAKYDLREWTERLESVFPFLDNALPNPKYHQVLESVEHLTPEQERPVKVILVPKTLSTPRIIAIEPTCMQFMQQAISVRLVRYLEDPRYFVSGFIGFRDQVPNQYLAKEGSLTGRLATLDLSEASDRVHNELVKDLFRSYTNIAEGVQASRSTRALVPGKGVIDLAKFASMGSALTFPVEAMVFLTVVMLGIEDAEGHRLTNEELLNLKGRVRVYGDDIIVPSDYARSVNDALEAYGFKVNVRKSFWTGKFRESCGKEYYDGHDVSLVKLRRELPDSRSNVKEVVSTVETRNQFYMNGMWETCRFLDEEILRLLRYYPIIEETSPLLGRVSVFSAQAERIDKDLQVPLVRGWKKVAKSPISRLDDIGALQKFLLKKGLEPFFDEEHLERYGRPDAVNIKLGWSQPY